jgi:membrane-bound lytic murein transglycosylase MltF
VLFCGAAVFAQVQSGPAATAAIAPSQPTYALPDRTADKWTGDLDGMIKRRFVRILVPYSKTFYFVDRGTQRGIAYEAGRLLEADLNKSVKRKYMGVNVVFVPVDPDQIIPAVVGGRGDIAIGNLTITPERLEQVDFTNPTAKNVSEILVTGPGAQPIESVDALSGQEVYVRKSSSFYESIERLNAEFTKAGKPPVSVRLAPEHLATEDILEMVNAGLVTATIADQYIATFWKQIFHQLELHEKVAVRTGGEIGWMLRKDSLQLKTRLNALIARYPEGSSARSNILKYLKSTRWVKAATSKKELEKFEHTVEFFRKYGDKYDLDYLLMMAQGYQESQLNQSARSPVGAVGVMQLMPDTGKDMRVGDILKLEPNIHAGVKYMRFMMDQFYADEPMDTVNKGLFTFASYNAGPGRIQQLRKLAEKRGLDPNVWFNNVEVIAAEKIGRETVQYVSNIYKYYLAYRLIEEKRVAADETTKAAEHRGER